MSVQHAFDKLNARRIALVIRKLDGSLSAEHKAELEAVTARCDAVVNALFPMPSLEEIGKRLGLAGLDDREDRQLEMLFACAPPDCSWCGAPHEGGPECCEDNERSEGPAGGAAERQCRQTRGR